MGVAKRGKEGLRGVACGGEVFNTVLYNPVSSSCISLTSSEGGDDFSQY